MGSRRSLWIVLPIQILLFAALTAFSAYATFKYFVQARPSHPTPRLLGLPLETAAETLGELGFALRVIGRERSEKAREGEVIAQQPVAGKIVREGGVIGVTIARAKSQTAMPDLLGLDIQQVRRLLGYHHLRVGKILKLDRSNLRRDTVLGTSPAPGEIVDPEESVDLLVSDRLGWTPYRMPDMVGRSIGEALEALDRLGATEIELDYEFRPEWPDGAVLRQFPHPEGRYYPADGLRLVLNRKHAPSPAGAQRVWGLAQYRVPPGFANKKVRLLMIDGNRLRALAEAHVRPGSVFRRAYLARPGATVALYVDGEEKAQWIVEANR